MNGKLLLLLTHIRVASLFLKFDRNYSLDINKKNNGWKNSLKINTIFIFKSKDYIEMIYKDNKESSHE